MKTFTVSVSRMARGKAGYKKNKRLFGWSFYPEEHNIVSLLHLAAVDGYSFLAGEFARKPPAHYGRSDVTTARITENFRQTCIIPLDDDGKESNPVEFWENDLLFTTYGGGYYHSASSRPDAPRIRPIFELDQPITEGKLYQEIRRAFGWYYNRDDKKRVDVLPQIPQVWYGSPHPTEYKILGNVLPVAALKELILKPYRKVKAAQAQQHEPLLTVNNQGDQVGYILNWLANRQSGDNRNLCLLWASGALKRLGKSWQTIGTDIIEACKANGYFQSYAATDNEIYRIFSKGKPQ